jgi:hypothetical protein
MIPPIYGSTPSGLVFCFGLVPQVSPAQPVAIIVTPRWGKIICQRVLLMVIIVMPRWGGIVCSVVLLYHRVYYFAIIYKSLCYWIFI